MINTDNNHDFSGDNPRKRPYNQNSDSRPQGNNQYPKRNNYPQNGGNFKPRKNFNNQGNNSGKYQPRRNFNNTQRDIPDDYGNRWGESDSNDQWNTRNNPRQPHQRYTSNRPQQSPYLQYRHDNFQPSQNSGNKNENFVETRFDNKGANVRFRKPYKKNPVNNSRSDSPKPVEYQMEYFDPSVPVRLNKFLANTGICSRREADEYIQAGVISVNGEIVTTLGTKILPTDSVKFHDQPVLSERKIYILLNKPKNCVTTTEDVHSNKNVMDIVRSACNERVYPVGRLDRNTTGVLLLTNDGDLASKLAHPKFDKKKVYQVTLDKPLPPEDFRKIMLGVELNDGTIAADALEYVNPDNKSIVGIEIHSGKNRVVRRIFEHLGYKVRQLDRVMFAGLTKKNLPRGKYRFLSEQEVAFLKMGNF